MSTTNSAGDLRVAQNTIDLPQADSPSWAQSAFDNIDRVSVILTQATQPDLKCVDRPKLSIVIPVYNERQTIEQVVASVRKLNIEKQIIIVDDGSTTGHATFLSSMLSRKTSKSF